MNRQVWISLALLVAVVAIAWIVWSRYGGEAEPPTPLEPAPAETEPAPRTVATPEPEPDPLPPLEASDELAAEALRGAGAAGVLGEALAEGSLVRRLVGAVNAVAQGRSPTAQIAFLEPERQFRAHEQAGELVVETGSFERYDPLVASISGLDAEQLVVEYARLEPLFQTAHAELGVDGRFRTVLLQAIDLLLATPVPSLPIRLEDHVEYYAYAEPELAELSEAQKHLLRLGPDNQRLLMAKLRQVREGLVGLR